MAATLGTEGPMQQKGSPTPSPSRSRAETSRIRKRATGAGTMVASAPVVLETVSNVATVPVPFSHSPASPPRAPWRSARGTLPGEPRSSSGAVRLSFSVDWMRVLMLRRCIRARLRASAGTAATTREHEFVTGIADHQTLPAAVAGAFPTEYEVGQAFEVLALEVAADDRRRRGLVLAVAPSGRSLQMPSVSAAEHLGDRQRLLVLVGLQARCSGCAAARPG